MFPIIFSRAQSRGRTVGAHDQIVQFIPGPVFGRLLPENVQPRAINSFPFQRAQESLVRQSGLRGLY